VVMSETTREGVMGGFGVTAKAHGRRRGKKEKRIFVNDDRCYWVKESYMCCAQEFSPGNTHRVQHTMSRTTGSYP